jgi:hypothetical protein
MRVRFLSTDGAAQYTPFEECDQRFTMNFYLAGLRGNSRYTAQNTLQWGGETMASRDVAMTTGAPMFQAPPASPLSTPLPTVDGILLHGIVNSAAWRRTSTATWSGMDRAA